MTDKLTATFQAIMDEMRGKYRAHMAQFLEARLRSYGKDVVGKTYQQVCPTAYGRFYGRMNEICRVYPIGDGSFNPRRDTFREVDEAKLAEYVSRETDHQTSMMFDGFVNKNVAKMFGVLKDVEVLEVVTRFNGNLTGYLVVKCVSGAGFRMSFQLETAVSPKGNVFGRFPTRFHDAVCTDGTKIRAASEAKMKKDFH